MTFRFGQSLTARFLWALCALQGAVLLASLAGTLYYLIDDKVAYVNESVTDALLSSVTVGEQLTLSRGEALEQLQQEHPRLWVIVAAAQRPTLRLGEVPAEYQGLVDNLLLIGKLDVAAFKERSELALHADSRVIDGVRVHVLAGGAATTDFNRLIFNITKAVSPYFLIPVLLFNLTVTPWVVLRATRGVRHVAVEASSLDISDMNSRLSEEFVPREIRPLVAAFNESMERLRTAYFLRNRFLRDAAHELRMPIAILMVRLDEMPSSPLKAQLLTDLERLANVAEQLLDLQRLHEPKAVLVPLDLVALARDMAADVAPLALSRNYELELLVPEQRVGVLGDVHALSRVLANLLQNALVHGGGRGRISLTVTADGSVAVADQGDGVCLADIEQIFQPFYRGITNKPGHGLGLHLVQEIVSRHGGRITAANVPGAGAIFTVYLQSVDLS